MINGPANPVVPRTTPATNTTGLRIATSVYNAVPPVPGDREYNTNPVLPRYL